jgi:all-trans-retinol dehydrogenase (NAD+)
MSEALQNLVNLVARSTRHVILNPIVTAALLWVLTNAPPQLHSRLTDRIAILRDPIHHAQIVKALKVCLALGSAAVLNKQMNHVALNSGRFRSEKARWNWSREVAVVTGGCSGIGELTVKRLINKGIRVAILDIRQLPPSLQGFANIKFFACDITNPNAVYSTAEQIKATLGAPTILINNAGILQPHTILNTSDEYLRKIFDVNVLSNWYTVKAFLPDMVRQNKGHIITIASTASFAGIAGMGDYNATKAAVLSFHESLNQELRLHYNSPNVLTTSIHPHWVRTPLLTPLQDELQKGGEPILEPAVVADAVVESVMSCSGRQVMLPSSSSRASLVRALPNWVQENVRSSVSKLIRKCAQ